MSDLKTSGIDPGVSSFLDALRIIAAMTVLLHHYLPPLFGADAHAIPGHDAVIIFFVMSGYVIAYVTAERDRTVVRYAIHRLARLWSVLMPALGLSLLAAILVGSQTLEVTPAIYSPARFAAAALKTATFLGEGWFGQGPAPYNIVVWSLNYEAWYYAIFAAFSFAPTRWRWMAAGGVLVLAGPGVATLFPCWMLGVWLFWNRGRLPLQPPAAYALFAACVTLYVFAYHYRLTFVSRHWLSELTAGQSYHLRGSTSVIGDLLIAPLVAGSILAFEHMPAVNAASVRARRIMKIASSRTLSLYLFHMPLFAILYGWAGLGHHGGVGGIVFLGLGIGLSVLLGSVSEARLPAWRLGLAAAISGVGNTLARSALKPSSRRPAPSYLAGSGPTSPLATAAGGPFEPGTNAEAPARPA